MDGAFSALEFATNLKNTNYIWFLVKRLDCERSTPVGHQKACAQKYPAIDDLEWPNGAGNSVVLSLIRGIKRSDGEVRRGNAAETLTGIGPCIASRVSSGEPEGGIPYLQTERLEAAERRVGSGKDPRDAIRTCGQKAQP